jgi:hypothetical protein
VKPVVFRAPLRSFKVGSGSRPLRVLPQDVYLIVCTTSRPSSDTIGAALLITVLSPDHPQPKRHGISCSGAHRQSY